MEARSSRLSASIEEAAMSDEIHIFAGPSLPEALRPHDVHFVFHEPVAQGDVYRLVQEHPVAIAIVDGYFERVPAVWHKEILWALSQGVRVYGAASMGALRAAELRQFGMVGVGKVFEAFRDGSLTDDDEVTLVHGDACDHFRPVSEALVNMRATLDRLHQETEITQTTKQRLLAYLKELYYPDRNYADLLRWSYGKIPDWEWETLQRSISRPESRVDQKQEDALLLLRKLRSFVGEGPAPLKVPWHFHHTDAWESVRRRAVTKDPD